MKFNRLFKTTLGTMAGLLAMTSQAEAVVASIKATGMAAVGVAYPQDALAPAFNPAGAVEICDRLDAGLTYGYTNGHSRVKGNALDSNPVIHAILGENVNGKFNAFHRSHNIVTPDFGINKRLGCDNEYAIGLVVYNRNYQKTTYKNPFVLFGTSPAGLEYLHETISPSFAWKINDCFNVGITVNYMVERIKVNGLQKLDRTPTSFTPPATPGNPLGTIHLGHVTNRGYNYAQGVSFTIGGLWHILPNLSVGATYQPKTSMTKLGKYDGFLAGTHGRLDVPAMYSAGIAWQWCCESTVALDVQHYAWNEIRALHNPLLHDGEVQLLGSKHGPGFGFKSQTFIRFGIDYRLDDCWTVRAGYRWGNTPIRRSQTVVNQLSVDCVESFLTLGASYQLNECNEISGFFAYGFEHTVKGKDSIPVGVPFVTPISGPFGFGGGESDLTESKLAVGLSWGWNY